MTETSWLWIIFNVFIVLMLVLDLAVFHRKAHEVSVKEALFWTGFWIALAFCFNIFIYYHFNEEKAFEFFTGYLIEKSLSVDNIFVFIMIFSFFKVPVTAQHKVLFWGIAGALVMRAVFIVIGIELIHKFHWLIYIFGGFLIITGIRFITSSDVQVNLEKNPLLKFLGYLIPVTPDFRGNKFFVTIDKRIWATPLFMVVILIEASDLIFALDSIPAILAISEDSFIVYTSNVFAILGLRSLYFALAGVEKYFRFLKYGLAVILVFVGTKMCIADLYKIPIEISLAFITLTLAVSVICSIALQKKESAEAS